MVEAGLIQRIHADQFGGDPFVDVRHGLRNSAAEILLLVAVAQFPCFVHAGAGAAGNGGPAERAVDQGHVDLNGRIAAAVENLSGLNVNDRTHGETCKRFWLRCGLQHRRPFCASRATWLGAGREAHDWPDRSGVGRESIGSLAWCMPIRAAPKSTASPAGDAPVRWIRWIA